MPITPFWVIIPARYASTRLPGKPLCDIAGQPMIQHVYQRACQSGASQVIIATDNQRIVDAAQQFDAAVCLTDAAHQSGTDRVAEVVRLYAAAADTIVVNVQGDEPLIPPSLIQQVALALQQQPTAQVATLCVPITETESLFNPNVVKVVRDKMGFALYFSRAPIPWQQQHFTLPPSTNVSLPADLYYRHLGIYAYRASYLQHCTQLMPTTLERAESLEQLRILFDGGRIYVEVATEAAAIGVDTAEDLATVRQIVAKSALSSHNN